MNFDGTKQSAAVMEPELATVQHHSPSLQPRRTVMKDGDQSHGLNELYSHFRGLAHRLRELYLSVYIKRYLW